MLLATFFGLHAGYGRFDFPFADFLPHGFPVLTSVHSSPNHFPSPPLLLATFLYSIIFSAPCAAHFFVFFRSPGVSVSRGINFKFLFCFCFSGRPFRGAAWFRFRSHYLLFFFLASLANFFKTLDCFLCILEAFLSSLETFLILFSISTYALLALFLSLDHCEFLHLIFATDPLT